MTKTVIFDFDRTIGTLVVDWSVWRKNIKDLILEFEANYEMEAQEIKHANQNYLIQKFGPEFRDRLNIINEDAEESFVTDFLVNDAVVEYIQRTDNELYCWSSNSRKVIDKYLAKIDVADRFERIISREDTYLLKPDNEGFKFIKKPEIELEEYLFVGDSEADRVAAEKSGISFMHVDSFSLQSLLSKT